MRWRFDGEPCERAIDALPSSTSDRVYRLDDEGNVLWTADASDVLRTFARRCALDVIHMWSAPEIVRRYLETGDETIREEAAKLAYAAAADAVFAAYSAVFAAYSAVAAAYSAVAAAYSAVAEAAVAAAEAAVAAAYAPKSAAKYSGWLEEVLLTLEPSSG